VTSRFQTIGLQASNGPCGSTAIRTPLVSPRGGKHHAVSDALTYVQAAAILGCHVSNVANLVAKGQLTSPGYV